MALNDPYSKNEVDSKLETVVEKMNTVEERIDHKFSLLRADIRHDMNEIMIGFKSLREDMDSRFEIMGKDIKAVKEQVTDLKGSITTTGIGLIIALVGALVGVIVPIAWTLWSNVFHPH